MQSDQGSYVSCAWAENAYGIPICRLHCLPCVRVNPEACENVRKQDAQEDIKR